MFTIRLLGKPTIESDGRPVRAPRGRKTWALLCYVLLAERPPARRQLAELLFGEADDPLGALRWTLAELRRALGRPEALRGDPVDANLGAVRVDLDLLRGDFADATPLLEVDGELLDGLSVDSSPGFESWLSVERSRVAGLIEARLRQAACARLAAGKANEAVPFATKAVTRNPYDEGNHVLLVRCLATAGDAQAAERQVAVCEDLLRREYGTKASPALQEARDASPITSGAIGLRPGNTTTAESQLEAGRAAIAAGAVDSGIQCLRRAVEEAARSGDQALQARALGALGNALTHSLRGRDEEGAVLLHRAIELADLAGDRATAVAACRALGYGDVQAGRRANAETWLQKAEANAETDAELAAILGVRGLNASDLGDYPAAFKLLEESIDRAENAGDDRQLAFSLAIAGRAHLLREERSQAARLLERSLELARSQRWLAFVSWPRSLRAELDLQAGELEKARKGFEEAWVLGCQVGDPCWEGMAARGLGMVSARHGDYAEAVKWLGEALVRNNRVTDRYQWIHAQVLDTLAGIALDHGDRERAGPLVATLAALAARCDLGELVVRAQLHRHRLGDDTALGAARLLGARIDNQALTQLIART